MESSPENKQIITLIKFIQQVIYDIYKHQVCYMIYYDLLWPGYDGCFLQIIF